METKTLEMGEIATAMAAATGQGMEMLEAKSGGEKGSEWSKMEEADRGL